MSLKTHLFSNLWPLTKGPEVNITGSDIRKKRFNMWCSVCRYAIDATATPNLYNFGMIYKCER